MYQKSDQMHLDFRILYYEHHGWLLTWLRRRLGNDHNADDFAQDTFVRVLGRSLDFDKIRKPRAWLATIAHGIVVDHVRRRNIERAYLCAIAHLPETEVPSPETRMLLIETLAHIDTMLNGLNSRVRSAFLLSRLEGMTYPEIAAHLGVSLSSVEKYMATAIRHCLMVRDSDKS